MATKKSRPAPKKSRLTQLAWLLFTAISGGGVTGYVKPDLPVVGQLVERIVSRFRSGEGANLAALVEAEGVVGVLANTLPITQNQGHGQYQGQALHAGQAPHAGQTPYAGQAPYQGQATAQLASTRTPTNSLLIASFNIQVLGKSKMSKPGMSQVLAQIIRQFDLVAIQEVRAKEDDILPELVATINADGSRYSFVIGPRLGRTVSTEQYAFVFNTNTVEHDPSSVGTMNDPTDLLHREPLVTRFRARTQSPDQAFTFWMVNIHTDPDDVPEEVDALADVFHVMRTARPDEDDVILLGDLNASETQLGRLGQYPGIRWAVSGVMTNTRRTKAYDNILFQGQSTAEYTGRWGVVDLESALGITQDVALTISDHLPVWAEFQLWEAPQQPSIVERFPGNRR